MMFFKNLIMNRMINVFAFSISLFMCSCDNVSVSTLSTFQPDTYGIPLCGGYRFDCGDGELSALIGPDGIVVVPYGAVLSVVRTAYCIGYYDKGAFYYRDGQRIALDRVFFVIRRDGSLHFYDENKYNHNFIGEILSEKVQFDGLGKPKGETI